MRCVASSMLNCDYSLLVSLGESNVFTSYKFLRIAICLPFLQILTKNIYFINHTDKKEPACTY